MEYNSHSVGAEGGKGEVRAALTPGPAPALRETLTPGPSPAARERGDLGGGHGSVDRCQRRIAPAPLISPLLSHSVGEEGGRGGGEGTLTPGPSPAARERGELGGGHGSVEEEGGWGEVRGIIPPSAPTAWKRKGAGGR